MTSPGAPEFLSRIEDMVEWSGKAVEAVQGVSFEQFEANEDLVMATAYRIAVIGEAAGKVPRDRRWELAPDLPWKDVIGMRSVLIHDYGAVDARQLFRTVTEEIPELLRLLQPALDRLKPSGDPTV